MLIMEPRKASPLLWVILVFFLAISLCGVKALSEEHHAKPHEGPFVERDQWRTLLITEFGEITAIDVKEGPKELPYHLQFFILEPNSLFLPVLLQADMVFYVHTGSGRLTWANDDGTSTIPLREGDVCSVNEGSVFYIQSNLEAERRKLRIYAMFTNTDDNTFDPSIGAYSRINELVKGFDKKIMQAALKVPEDLIDAIINKSNTPAIVHAVPEKRNIVQELEATILKSFFGFGSNSKKLKTYNIFDHDPDFKSPNGWSTAVTKKQLKSLKRTNIGFLMVNLTMGSILGPHWNPKATELAVGVDGGGMVRVVCGSGNEDETECKNMGFKVKKGDAFVVPRFHPMAQMSFNNGPFVFLGFSTSAKKNHPQFLAGKGSVLHILDKQILATSFGVSNKTIEHLLSSPNDSIIFGCSSCAEEEEKIMKEEEEKRKREEEEEKRKREEEEEKRKREEEEKKRKREEEERRRREEEEEEKKKKEEEEAKRQQEEREREREREEEEKKKKEEEEKRRREEEEEARKKEEERKREEEEAKRQQEEREKEREEEAEREEEEAGREREWRRKREAAAAKREQERREMRRQKEEAKKRAQEQARREAEEAAQRKEEQARRERERRREEEEAAQRKEEQARRERERRREEEEETARREQEQQQKRERRRQEEKQREGDQDEPAWWKRIIREEKGKRPEQEVEWEQEEAMRQQEEREKRRDRDSDRRVEEQSFEGRRVLKIRSSL